MSRNRDRTLAPGAEIALPWLERNTSVTHQIATDLSPPLRERTIFPPGPGEIP